MDEGTGPSGTTAVEGAPDEYALKDLERAICEDDRVTELGVRLSVRGGRVVVHGTMLSSQRRDEVVRLVRELGVNAPVIAGGIIPEDDRPRLLDQGVAAVYTPKDFELARIMGEVLDLVG